MRETELYYRAIEENLAPSERIYLQIVREKPVSRVPRRLALTAAACLVFIAAAIACIPEARAAVMSWLRPAVDARVYINTPAEERVTAPAVSAAIEKADKQGITVTVADAADATWQAWAEKLSVELNELLYDGETLHITGMLKGNTADFVKPRSEYTVTESENGVIMSISPPENLVMCTARYSLNGGEVVYNFFSLLSSGHRCSEPEYVAERLTAGELPFSADLDVGSGLAGVQGLVLDLLFTDMKTLWENPVMPGDTTQPVQVALRIEGLTFDATAGTAANESLPRPAPVPLSGDVLVFAYEENEADGTAMVGNDLLSLEGGAFSALKLQQRLTGTAVTLGISLPVSWTPMQCSAFYGRVSAGFLIDGQDQGGAGTAYMSIRWYDEETIASLGLEAPPDMSDPHNIVFSVETGLMPEDWAHIESLDIVLCVDELTEYNHVKLPTDGRVRVAVEKNSWSEDSARKLLTGCPLKVK